MVIIAYIKVLIEGEVSGLRPRTSPFWVFVVTMCIFEIFFSGEFSSVLYMMVGHHIWRGPAGFGRSAKSFSIYFFGKFTLGLSLGAFPLPCGSQPLGHINHYTIILHASIWSNNSFSNSACHVSVWTATWCNFICPQNDPEMPNMSDMWKPLVLPCHHVDVM
jgi:hypothetical protein